MTELFPTEEIIRRYKYSQHIKRDQAVMLQLRTDNYYFTAQSVVGSYSCIQRYTP